MTVEEKRFPRVWDLFFVITLTFLLLITVEVVWRGSLNKCKILFLEFLTLLPVLIFILVKKFSFRDVFRWQKVNGHILLVSGIIGLGLSIVIDELDCLIQKFISMPEELYQGMRESMMFDTTGELILLILGVVIMAAFAEEMLFRGFFQGSLEQITNPPKAILVTAFVFAFVHFNPWWFVEILILSIFLGIMVWRSGSLFPCVIVHAVNNALAIVLINTEPANLEWYRFKGHVFPMWVVLGLGCVVFGFRIFYGLSERGS